MTGYKREVIMLVDDNQVTLNMGKNMLKDYYEVYALPSAERLFKFLENTLPDLILLDVAMPHMNGFEVLKILRADAKYANIPIIFVTSHTDEMDELEGLELGAVDYITKPFSAAILLKRIQNHLLIKKQQVELKEFNENLIEMVKDKTEQVSGLQDSIVSSLAEIVEFRDEFTGGHIYRTQQYVKLLMNYLIEHEIYLEEASVWTGVDNIIASTQLHDLGKIFIEDAILNKPGKLTEEEFDVMKTHAQRGYEAIRHMQGNGQEQAFLDNSATVALTHHEKWDGSGYPKGLKGCEIPLIGRLMAIADVYDALTSKRPYKEAFSAQESAKIIINDSGSHFDPELVGIFDHLKEQFAVISRYQSR